ncbi:MAG: NAD(P)H-binding protein [Myxococcales bacterium]|nr:NAD(P)H-binding protein [Myxococcales bacterium]
MDTPSAFVAGATGLTGRHLVALLAERGIRTIAHLRPDSPRLEAWRARFDALGAEVDTSAWTQEAMEETLRAHRPDWIFSLLGTTRRRAAEARREGQGEESYEQVDYALSSRLIRAAQKLDARPRFIFLSAAGVRPSSRAPYLRARAKVEAELQQSGLPFVIARPSFILGDRDRARHGETIGAAVADALLGIASSLGARRLRSRFRSTTGEALALALATLAADPDTAGRVVESDELWRLGHPDSASSP